MSGADSAHNGPPVPAAGRGSAAALLADSGPWPGFVLAAEAVARDLYDRFGSELWLVTHVEGDRQVVVASTGPWAELAPPAVALPWAQSFCIRMVHQDGRIAVADVARSPHYAAVAVGLYARVQAYLGVPVRPESAGCVLRVRKVAARFQREGQVRRAGNTVSCRLARAHCCLRRTVVRLV